MEVLTLPDDVVYVLETLEESGFEAYVAGGAVRDLLMGHEPHDYDIATSALPDDVKRIFTKVVDTGIKHGTVTVIINGTGYEVTTFRTDGEYKDSRHPTSVAFVSDIREDCRRRDFTINAMVYSPKTGVKDFFDGRGDLNRGVIRCVGDAEKRFLEDALRMLRAVRFSAVMSFELDESVCAAIEKYASLIRFVSRERIAEELNKILLSPNPDAFRTLNRLGLLHYIMPELERCFEEPQRNKYHIYNVGEHIMHTVKYTPPDLIVRWAALMHDIGKPCCVCTDKNGTIHFYGHHRESRRIAVDILHRLRMDSESIKRISVLVENHDVRVDAAPPSVKRTMARTGGELFEKLLALQRADNRAKNPKYYPEKLRRINAVEGIYREVLAEGQPYLVQHLKINGNDLIKLGFRTGKGIGDTLKVLLDEIIINPSLNHRAYLVKRAKELKRRV